LHSAARPTLSPLTLVSSVSPLFWLTADTGCSGALWSDQGPNHYDCIQGSGGLQPALFPTGGPNGTPTLKSDGVDDFMVMSGWNPSAPVTQPMWFWLVAAAHTGVVGSCLFASTGITALTVNVTSTTTARQRNTTAANTTALVLNTFFLWEAYFSGSTADYLRIGPNLTSGTSAGNTDASLLAIFGSSGGSGLVSASMCQFGAFAGQPTTLEKANLQAWLVAKYPSLSV
jgi:hypothetical protein